MRTGATVTAGTFGAKTTTIRQDRRELGMLAASRAIELIEDPEATPPDAILPVELVVRASSS